MLVSLTNTYLVLKTNLCTLMFMTKENMGWSLLMTWQAQGRIQDFKKVGSFVVVLRYLYDNRWKLNFESDDKYENIACLDLLSLFMDSKQNVTAYYCQRRLALCWAQLNNHPRKKYKLDPSQTTVCIWRWTWNRQIFKNNILPRSAKYGLQIT